jgi:hypothetical protein
LKEEKEAKGWQGAKGTKRRGERRKSRKIQHTRINISLNRGSDVRNLRVILEQSPVVWEPSDDEGTGLPRALSM